MQSNQLYFLKKKLFIIFLSCIFLPACALNQAKNDKRMEEIEKQVGKNEESINELTQRVSVLQFMLDDHERALRDRTQIKEKEEKKKIQEEKLQGDIREDKPLDDPVKFYELAFNTLKNQDYKKAADYFKEIAERYPEHELANNSLYWLGESYYARRDYRTAIDIFDQLKEKYPNRPKVPDALLKKAFSLINLGEKEKAREILRELIRDYPFTNAAAKAETRLKTLF